MWAGVDDEQWDYAGVQDDFTMRALETTTRALEAIVWKEKQLQQPRPRDSVWDKLWAYNIPNCVISAWDKVVHSKKEKKSTLAEPTVVWQPDTLGPIYRIIQSGFAGIWHSKILPLLTEFDWVALAKTCRSLRNIVR
jgi:hypothetical protein